MIWLAVGIVWVLVIVLILRTIHVATDEPQWLHEPSHLERRAAAANDLARIHDNSDKDTPT